MTDHRLPGICVVAWQWSAPEVCAGSDETGTVATTASDVYMVGGFLYELLTAGTVPFHWLAVDRESEVVLGKRRATAEPVPFPGVRGGLPGLLGKSVLEVAADEGEPIPWCVRVDGSPGSAGRLEALKALLVQCLATEPDARPKVASLLQQVDALLVDEHRDLTAAPMAGAGGPRPAPPPPVPFSPTPEVPAQARVSSPRVQEVPAPTIARPAVPAPPRPAGSPAVPNPCTKDPEPAVLPTGITVDSLVLERILLAKKQSVEVCSAACEMVADAHDNCVDCVALPEVLLAAGMPPTAVMDLVLELAKVQ